VASLANLATAGMVREMVNDLNGEFSCRAHCLVYERTFERMVKLIYLYTPFPKNRHFVGRRAATARQARLSEDAHRWVRQTG
jgi:hypothetical protein